MTGLYQSINIHILGPILYVFYEIPPTYNCFNKRTLATHHKFILKYKETYCISVEINHVQLELKVTC